MTNKPIFITGNQNKANYLSKLLGIDLEHQKVDLDEIQDTSVERIVEHKVRQAYGIVGAPVLVEDTGLRFEAFGELPGPFIKYFAEQDDGAEKICRMLDGFSNRRAEAYTVFGYFDGKTSRLFRGSAFGEIAKTPGRADTGFGWDVIFIPDGFGGVVRSELSVENYDTIYQTIKPLAQIREFLLRGEA